MQSIGGVFLIIIGLVGAYCSQELGIGKISSPGPGLWPFVLSILIIVTSLVTIISERKSEKFSLFSSESKDVLYGVILIAAYGFLFEILGLAICSLIFVFAWTKFLGKESWRISFAVSVVVTVVLYLVFIQALDLPIPMGIW